MTSDLELHARLAKQAFDRTWELLDLATGSTAAARRRRRRAARVAGDDAALASHLAAARALLEQIEDAEDREILAADLASL